jgi:uncharacterized protein with ParB-like and HNH nuclease domain
MEVLKKACATHLLLPDIQRNYVWKPSQIEELFESILRGYPLGSFIFWKTTQDNINQEKLNLYLFFSQFSQGETENEKAPSPLGFGLEEEPYFIVLDGQQRITSLYIALYGSYKYHDSKRGRSRKDLKWKKTTELYYIDEISESNKEKFCFLTEDEASRDETKYYKVKNLIGKKNSEEISKELINNGYSETARQDLTTLFSRLNETKMISYYPIENMKFDDALDIFVKINSTGTKLSKGDLIFSTLINGWNKGKEEVDTLIKEMNKTIFCFDRNYIMKACLFLTDNHLELKIQSFSKKEITEIRNNWDLIKKSLKSMAEELEKLRFCKDNMPSNNATLPIAYYIFKGGKTSHHEDEFKKFLTVSFAKRIFGNSSDNILRNIKNKLMIDCKKEVFSLNLFSEITAKGGTPIFKITETDIEVWLNNYEKGADTYPILLLLYSNLNWKYQYHQDHCHPFVAFKTKDLKKIGLKDSEIKEWQKNRNLLPNLQLLESSENERKKDTPLKKWVEDGNRLEYREKASLELKDFEEFFKERRELMKKELMKIFGIPCTDQK